MHFEKENHRIQEWHDKGDDPQQPTCQRNEKFMVLLLYSL